MRITTILMLAITVLLSACNNHKPTSNPNRGTVVPYPTGNASGNTHKPAIDKDVTSAADPSKTILLDRIRNGFEFPELDSKYTKDYVKWNVNHPTYLTDLFARAEPFLFYIVEEIDRRDLPMELALLPVVESAYKPNAISSSNASGLWQFIPSTGKDYGLHQDWWFDGRRDFIEATNAALDYLTMLNSMFDGDWHLTLAAYNAGQGTILRAINNNKRRGKKTNYQALSLRAETTKYLPKLQALKDIINDPEKYNVSLANIANQPYFEIVTLPGQIDLQHFSDLANLDIETVRHLNAGHLRWATSPTGPHRLLLPISNHAQTALALEQIKANPKIEYQQHAISKGETLSQISRRYGVKVSDIQKFNKLSGTNIRAGKTLMIPIATNPSMVASQDRSNNEASNKKLVHHVVKGETLWSISKRYNVKLNQILSWNQLTKSHILKLNQELLIFTN